MSFQNFPKMSKGYPSKGLWGFPMDQLWDSGFPEAGNLIVWKPFLFIGGQVLECDPAESFQQPLLAVDGEWVTILARNDLLNCSIHYIFTLIVPAKFSSDAALLNTMFIPPARQLFLGLEPILMEISDLNNKWFLLLKRQHFTMTRTLYLNGENYS